MGIKENDSNTRKFFLKMGGVLAVVMHPVFLFFYCCLFVHFALNIGAVEFYFFEIFGIILILTIVFPVIFTIFYSKDLFMKDRKKRPLTILFTTLCYLACFYCMYLLVHKSSRAGETFDELGGYMIILSLFIVGLLFILYVSFRYKISFHAYGIGFILALIVVSDFYFAHHLDLMTILAESAMIILGGILLWQRIASGSHNKREVLYGFFSGLLITMLIFLPVYQFLMI